MAREQRLNLPCLCDSAYGLGVALFQYIQTCSACWTYIQTCNSHTSMAWCWTTAEKVSHVLANWLMNVGSAPFHFFQTCVKSWIYIQLFHSKSLHNDVHRMPTWRLSIGRYPTLTSLLICQKFFFFITDNIDNHSIHIL